MRSMKRSSATRSALLRWSEATVWSDATACGNAAAGRAMDVAMGHLHPFGRTGRDLRLPRRRAPRRGFPLRRNGNGLCSCERAGLLSRNSSLATEDTPLDGSSRRMSEPMTGPEAHIEADVTRAEAQLSAD